MFTLGNIILFIVMIIIGIVVTIGVGLTSESLVHTVLSAIISFLIIGGIIGIIAWYNTNTASGVRALKDWKSEINNGIDREIIITAEDGREIFYYEGKVDVETNHNDNYIKFETEDDKRYIIYYGIQDTIIIKEK